jgi:hypothetical protein
MIDVTQWIMDRRNIIAEKHTERAISPLRSLVREIMRDECLRAQKYANNLVAHAAS